MRARGLTVRYGRKTAIEGLDLEVAEGEIFGFLGPNGAGKTTTIRCFLDLLRPDRGSAELFGVEARRGGGALRREVGFLPGDLAFLPGLSGRRALSLFEKLQGRPARRREEILERLEFPREALGRRIRDYSTGMRQALGLTIALQHAPRLAILDEPTTGLDPLVREAFLDLVREAPSRGTTVFLSSHVLEEIERVADRVGLVARARLELVSSVEELRRDRPRRVRIVFRDGRVEERSHLGPIQPLLDDLAGRELEDLEIRPPALETIFRTVVRGRKEGE